MEACPTCLQIQQEHQVLMKERKEARSQEQSTFEFLMKGSDFPTNIDESKRIFLLSKDWVSDWKKYIENLDRGDPPSLLDNTAFLCADHSQLKYDVTGFIAAKLGHVQVSDNDVPFCFLEQEHWNNLLAKYGCDKSVPLSLAFKSKPENPAEFDFALLPPVCLDCAKKQQIVDEEQRLSYKATTLTIEILPEKKEEESAPQPTFAVFNSKRRKNKGRRSNASGSRYAPQQTRYHLRGRVEEVKTIKIENVSCDQTLQLLKLQIFEQTEIVPFQQSLSYKGTALEGDDKTLYQLKIEPMSTLQLDKRKENASILDGNA